MTSHKMARSCLFQGWTFLFTEFLRVLAAGMETAARRQIRRVPYLAGSMIRSFLTVGSATGMADSRACV